MTLWTSNAREEFQWPLRYLPLTIKTKKSTYEKINSLGEYARKELEKVFDGKVAVSGKGSLFMTHFLKNGVTKIDNSIDVAKCDTEMLQKYHFKMISEDGIFFLPGAY